MDFRGLCVRWANEVNDAQITILGEKSVNKTVRVARIIFL